MPSFMDGLVLAGGGQVPAHKTAEMASRDRAQNRTGNRARSVPLRSSANVAADRQGARGLAHDGARLTETAHSPVAWTVSVSRHHDDSRSTLHSLRDTCRYPGDRRMCQVDKRGGRSGIWDAALPENIQRC